MRPGGPPSARTAATSGWWYAVADGRVVAGASDAVEPGRPLPPDHRRQGDDDDRCAQASGGEHDDRRGEEHAQAGGVGPQRVGNQERRKTGRGIERGAEADDPCAGRHDHRRSHHQRPDQGSGAKRKLAALGEQHDRCADRGHGEGSKGEHAEASCVQRRGGEGEGEHHRGNRTGRRREGDQHDRDHGPAALEGSQCRQPDGEPECKRQAADGNVDDRACGEQHARGHRPVSVSPAGQDVERAGRDDAAHDGDGCRPEGRAEHREEDPVARCVVAGEPQVVPDRRTVPLDELETQQLGRPIGPPPSEHHGEQGERSCRHRRRGVGTMPGDPIHHPTTVVVPM